MARRYTVRDIDGSNPRSMTLADFLAEHERKKAEALAIFARSLDALEAKQGTSYPAMRRLIAR